MIAKKTKYDGHIFDSEAEKIRYVELKRLQRKKEISNLRLQVEYELCPAVFEEVPTGEIYTRGEHKGEQKYKKQCIERSLSYIADFVYTDKYGNEVVEDVKGEYARKKKKQSNVLWAYRIFKIKRKLMLYRYGIKIKEVIR